MLNHIDKGNLVMKIWVGDLAADSNGHGITYLR